MPESKVPTRFSRVKVDEDIQAASLSLSTPLLKANANISLKRERLIFDFGGGKLLIDGDSYVIPLPVTFSGVIKSAYVACGTRMAGGTSTLALEKKNGGSSVSILSTANVDPAVVPAAAVTGQALTLSASAPALAFVPGDCLTATLACGTMTTDGKGYVVVIEVEPNDV